MGQARERRAMRATPPPAAVEGIVDCFLIFDHARHHHSSTLVAWMIVAKRVEMRLFVRA
jgi:hypothetical protein